jgi:hypothetical protein
MHRWSFFSVVSIAFASFGCSASVEPGLANAPRLGGTGLADESVHDVIANGADSCGRHAERGPLRYRVPPCPTVTSGSASTSPIAAPGVASENVAVPWLQHFYVGWPCAHPAPVSVSASEAKAVAWASMPASAKACGSL